MSIEITTGVWNPKVHKFSQSFKYELFTDFILSCGIGFISLLFLFPYQVLPFFFKCINYSACLQQNLNHSLIGVSNNFSFNQYALVLWGCNVFCKFVFVFFFNCFLFSFSCYGLWEGCPVQILHLSLTWLLCFWVNSFPDFPFAVHDFIAGSLQACQDSAWTSCEFWLVMLSQ